MYLAGYCSFRGGPTRPVKLKNRIPDPPRKRRYFEAWAVTAFRLFRGHGLSLIATFNEPTCAAFTGHIVGVHAPGRRGAVRGAGRVLLNMLRAHSAAYRAIRAEPGGEAVRVGLVHQKIRFEAEGRAAGCGVGGTCGNQGRTYL